MFMEKKVGWVNIYKYPNNSRSFVEGVIRDSESDAIDAFEHGGIAGKRISTILIEWEEEACN